MADKKLNQVTTKNDANYIYAEDSNGNTIKISKADLASVVGGLIGEATENKSGLMNPAYIVKYIARLSLYSYKLFKISGDYSYSTFEIFVNTDDGRMMLCLVTYSDYALSNNPIKPVLIKEKDFNGYIKFFRKSDSNDFYFQLYASSNTTSLYIKSFTSTVSPNVIKESNESTDSLIEVPMS